MISPPPAVSVLLPVYNGKRTLHAALASLLDQTFPNFEILVLDDGSTDRSMEIAASFQDDRVHIIRDGQNLGLAGRLNVGIDMARGRYLARMDHDDIAFPERLARQVEFLDSHPEVDVLGTRAVVFSSTSPEPIGLLPYRRYHEELVSRAWMNIPLPHPTWMGRAEWFRRFHYAQPEPARAEDQELLLRAHQASRYHCLEDVLLAYRLDGFPFRKMLKGRLSLMREQVKHFWLRGAWPQAGLSVAVAVAKITIDTLTSCPGMNRLYFMRLKYGTPLQLTDQLGVLLQKYACEAGGGYEAHHRPAG